MNKVGVLLVLAVLPLFSACGIGRYLDFGGVDKKPFEVRFFWDRGPKIGPEDPSNPGYDKDGNKIPSPGVAATYFFPDIHAGMAWIDGNKQLLTPTINIELMEFKVPFLRWFIVAVGAGSQEVHIYLGKRITSVLETSIGPMIVYRFDEDDWSYGFQGTLIKF